MFRSVVPSEIVCPSAGCGKVRGVMHVCVCVSVRPSKVCGVVSITQTNPLGIAFKNSPSFSHCLSPSRILIARVLVHPPCVCVCVFFSFSSSPLPLPDDETNLPVMHGEGHPARGDARDRVRDQRRQCGRRPSAERQGEAFLRVRFQPMAGSDDDDAAATTANQQQQQVRQLALAMVLAVS